MTPLDYSIFLANMFLIADSLEFAFLLSIEFLDILTGTVRAFRDREVNSTVSYIGISRKVLTVSIVLIIGALFKSANLDIYAQDLVVGYMIPQFYSLAENLYNIGIPLPTAITKYFEKIKDNKPDVD